MKHVFFVICLVLIIVVIPITIVKINTPDIEEARKVKVGMTDSELKKIMGEPYSIKLSSGYEEWYFTYETYFLNKEGMCVKMVNNKIDSFYSY